MIPAKFDYVRAGSAEEAISLLQEIPNPTEDEVRMGLEGNLCRCTGYHNIVLAVLDAAKRPGASEVSITPAGVGR